MALTLSWFNKESSSNQQTPEAFTCCVSVSGDLFSGKACLWLSKTDTQIRECAYTHTDRYSLTHKRTETTDALSGNEKHVPWENM